MKMCDYSTYEFGQRCRAKKAVKIIRAKYKPREEDVLYLCDECAVKFVNEWKGSQVTVRDYKGD